MSLCRVVSPKNIKIISIEGIIAAGKSTLTEILKNESKYKNKIHVLKEPIECWQDVRKNINGNVSNLNYFSDENFNILQSMYEDNKRWSYTMQVKYKILFVN